MLNKTVTVVGGGVAGMSAACALAEAGFRVQLVERRGYLGGRARSYLHPGVNEVIDNCQHVLFGCCTNLDRFLPAHRRRGQDPLDERDDDDRAGRPAIGLLGPSGLPAPLHGLPKLLTARALSLRADKMALARAFRVMMRPVPADSTESLGAWLDAARADAGRHRAFLAAGDCERAECAIWMRSRCHTRPR